MLYGGERMIATMFMYNSANIKARSLYGKLLSADDYSELLDRRTVGDVAAYLKKNTEYGHLLSDINENMVHRGNLERVLKTSLFEDYFKFFRFLSGSNVEFLKAVSLRHEAEDLKMLLRVIYNGQNAEAFRESLIFLSSYSTLDFKKLASAKNIPGVIDFLKGTEYYKVLLPFKTANKKINLFDIEMALDMHYFIKIGRLMEKLLSGGNFKAVEDMLGVQIDIANLLLIYRCKKLLRLPGELISKYIIPNWYHLTREQLVQISRCRDTEEFRTLVAKTKYKGIFENSSDPDLENNSMNYMYKVFKRHLRKDVFNIGTIIAYLHLKEIDIRNIITLIEGVRYSIPKEEIKSYLIGINT